MVAPGPRDEQALADIAMHARLLASPALHLGAERRLERPDAAGLAGAVRIRRRRRDQWPRSLVRAVRLDGPDRPPRLAERRYPSVHGGHRRRAALRLRAAAADQPVRTQELRRPEAHLARHRLGLGVRAGRERAARRHQLRKPLSLTIRAFAAACGLRYTP